MRIPIHLNFLTLSCPAAMSPNLSVGVRKCLGWMRMPGGVVKQDVSQHVLSGTHKKCFPEVRGSVNITAWKWDSNEKLTEERLCSAGCQRLCYQKCKQTTNESQLCVFPRTLFIQGIKSSFSCWGLALGTALSLQTTAEHSSCLYPRSALWQWKNCWWKEDKSKPA